MFLEIISPEKKLFSGEVTSVTVPGSSGTFQILNNHAAIISTLQQGTVSIETAEGKKQFEVTGGVVEVLKNKIVVLAG
ncbi:MAG: ATP synthase F1 subunit epsilon [Bacteroidia bacterium]|nr:ATP synthase F1 subunit epsilon [Bacteroidia bacterium]MCZ2278129.1 ATP synthase F1 subunit epsilon [Bacteroidia bacterium]